MLMCLFSGFVCRYALFVWVSQWSYGMFVSLLVLEFGSVVVLLAGFAMFCDCCIINDQVLMPNAVPLAYHVLYCHFLSLFLFYLFLLLFLFL